MQVTKAMGCRVSTTVEGWQERLASVERRVQKTSSETSLQSRTQQPSGSTQSPLSVPETTLLHEGHARQNPPFTAAVGRLHDPLGLNTIPENVAEAGPVQKTFRESQPSREQGPTQSSQPSCSSHRRALPVLETMLPQEEEDRYQYFSVLAVAPPHTILDPDDDNDLDIAMEQSYVRNISIVSTATFTSVADSVDGVSWVPVDCESCHSSSTFKSALDAAEMIRAESKAVDLRKLTSTPAFVLTSLVKRKRARIDSVHMF